MNGRVALGLRRQQRRRAVEAITGWPQNVSNPQGLGNLGASDQGSRKRFSSIIRLRQKIAKIQEGKEDEQYFCTRLVGKAR